MRYPTVAIVLAFLIAGGPAAASAQVVESSVLEKNCDAGDQDACVDLGQRLWDGQFGLKRDTVRAISVLERACDAGKPDGCYRLGEHLKSSRDAAGRARAVPLLQKACDNKHGDSCASLGAMYGTGATIGRDDSRVSSLLEQACNLRSIYGCIQGARWHSPLDGTQKDATRWAAYTQKLCDVHGQPQSCLLLGLAYDSGMWVPKNPDHANELFKKSCAHGINVGVKEGCALIRR